MLHSVNIDTTLETLETLQNHQEETRCIGRTQARNINNFIIFVEKPNKNEKVFYI